MMEAMRFPAILAAPPRLPEHLYRIGRAVVGGLSMGGYGAFKLALSLPERYSAAASLSGALDIREVVKGTHHPEDKTWIAGVRNVFGDLNKVPGSKHDLFTLAKKAARAPVKPRLYQCCGTEDFLYADNLRFRDAVQKLSFDYTYEEGPGDHNWADRKSVV